MGNIKEDKTKYPLWMNTRKNIVFFSVLLVCLFFVIYIAGKAISSANEDHTEQYLRDSAQQSAKYLHDIYKGVSESLKLTAKLYGECETVTRDDLQGLNETMNSFRNVMYTDANGICIDATGNMYDCSMNGHYIFSMEGRSGMDFVAGDDNRENRLIFFTPHKYKGEIKGAFLGELDKSKLFALLSNTFFDENVYACICVADGNIIASNGDSAASGNILKFFRDSDILIEEEGYEDLMNVFRNGGSCHFEYIEGGKTNHAYAVSNTDDGWIILQSFPQSVTDKMFRKTYNAVIACEIMCFLLLGVYLVYVIYMNYTHRRKLIHERVEVEREYKRDKKEKELQLKSSLGERTLFFEALTDDSAFYYFADLTDDMIYESPVFKNNRDMLLRKSPEFPIKYSEYIRLSRDAGNIDPQIDIVSNRETLLKMFGEGKTNIEAELLIPALGMYIRKNFLLLKDAKTGHIMANVIGRDITDEREHEFANYRFSAAISNIYNTMFRVNFKDGTLIDLRAPEYLRDHADTLKDLRSSIDSWFTERFTPEVIRLNEDFRNPQTICEKLRYEESVSRDMQDKSGGWERLQAVILKRDSDGTAQEALLLARKISHDKEKELEAQRKLNEAYEAARNANRAKTDFLSRMSHDIRTPMNGIIGMTQLAKKHSDDPERMEDCLEKIEQSSEHLLTLVNDILDLSRIESGRTVLTHEKTDLKKNIDVCVSILSASVINRDIAITLSVAPLEVNYVYTDELHLRQVLLNIISNAVKYTPDGGRISFEAESRPSEKKGWVNTRFIVEDTGIGMSKKYLEHIYEPFSQENDHDARTKFKGSGLGMAIVKEYMQLFGGSIDIESETNKGTKVTLCFPFEVVPEDQITNVVSEQQEPVGPMDFEGMRVMIVEDNDLNREIVEDLFREIGLDVVSAVNGQQAVDMFTASKLHEFDMIFMDIMMPVLNGYEATHAIRELNRPDAKTVPIIAMTANAFDEDVKDSLDNGMNAHIAKPIDMRVVMATINRHRKKKI